MPGRQPDSPRPAFGLALIDESVPSVSVIIATHNRPRTLARAIESARASARGGVEVVVVDDASGDETERVCRATPGIVYVRVERNQGVAGARNIGLLASRGDYLTFLDDDDVRLPGSLDRQVEALASAPEAAFVYGQALIGQQSGAATGEFYPARCPRGDVFWELLAQNFVPCGAAVFRRSCLYGVGLMDDGISGIDDWDLWVRLSERYEVLAEERPVVIWRRSTPATGQGTSRAAALVGLSARQFRRHWLGLPRAAEAPAARQRESWRRFSDNMAKHLLWETWRALAAGLPVQALRNCLAALRLFPAAVVRVISPSSLRYLLEHAPREWRAIRGGARPSPESTNRGRR